MRERDALWRRRRTGRELDEGEIVERDVRRRLHARTVEQVAREDERQLGTLRTQRLEERLQRSGRDECPRACGAQDACRLIHIARHIAHRRRRVQGGRDEAGERHAEQRREERFRIRDHDGDEIAGAKAVAAKRVRDAERLPAQIGERAAHLTAIPPMNTKP